MASRRMMGAERVARLIALALAVGLPLAAWAVRWSAREAERGRVVELRGAMAEEGGWLPTDFTMAAGQPLRLRLTSDDVVHGFAVGQSDLPAVEVLPGQVTETTLQFDQPGTYTYYCTRWCGPNHWRMRGTIEVVGTAAPQSPPAPPPYMALGIDIDAPHPAEVVPAVRPSAVRGALLGVSLPAGYISADYYRAHSPAQAWLALRAEYAAAGLSDKELWDLVAFAWRANATSEALAEGRALFAANCAACHGEAGRGDGVMAPVAGSAESQAGHPLKGPANFADPATMLGASPALLHGKIVRGGMGTGMPYWGPIFTEAQTWALVGYLWTFSMEYGR